MPSTRSDGRKVLASFKSWEDFGHSLDHVELRPPVDNYGETRQPAKVASSAARTSATVQRARSRREAAR